MKWFKHQSNSHNDERLAALEDKCGLEGYGFYFKMLEIVALTIGEANLAEAIYSQTRWARQVNISTKKYLFLLQCCSDVGLMSFQRDGDNILVKIPNLLKYRDNHTRNLQVTNKPRACAIEVEEDKEREKEEKKEAKASKEKPPAFQLPEWMLPYQEAWDGWIDFRRSKKYPLSPQALNLALNKLKDLNFDGEPPDEVLNEAVLRGWRGIFSVKNQRGNQNAGNKPKTRFELIAEGIAKARAERESRAQQQT